MKLSKLNLSAILIALIFGASLFFYSPAFLIGFAFAAFASIGSINLSKNLRSLIWTIVTFSLFAATTSLLSGAQQHIPSIFLWCAVSIAFCIVFSCISFDVVCHAILIFYFAFLCFELNLIWIFLSGATSDPASLVEMLDSPVMVVPNDFAYFAVVLPLLFRASRHFSHGLGVNLLLAGSLALFLMVSLILESRLALAGFAILSGSEIAGKLAKKYRPWIILLVFAATVVVFSFVIKKGSSSLEARLVLWVAAISGFVEAPWFGNGFGTFGSYYDQFKETGFELFSSIVSVDQRYVPWPHNIFLELVFFYGLSGVIPMVAFLKSVVENLRKGIRIDRTAFQLLLLLAPLAMLEMSLLRLQTIPIFLIIWLSISYDLLAKSHGARSDVPS